MYAIHTTPGFVIASRPYGEADRILSIFTRELGLVQAVAQGIRLEKSKLRYHAQDYSTGTFSLVRGKDFWRLISTQPGTGCFLRDDLAAKIAALLRRLLQGEEPHPELFDELVRFGNFMAAKHVINVGEGAAFETIAALKILRLLGYIGDDKLVIKYALPGEIAPDQVRNALAERTKLNKVINDALKESHL